MGSPITGSTSWHANDPLSQTKWSKKFFAFMLENMMFSTLMGTVVNQVTDLKAGKGASVVLEIEAPLTGNGVGDNDRLITESTDNTEDLKNYNQTIVIHERAHGVQEGGKISSKFTKTDVKSSGLRRLGVWASEVVEEDIVRAVSCVGNVASAIETVNNMNPTQNRYFAIGQDTSSPYAVNYAMIDGTSSISGGTTANLPLAGFTADATAVASRFGTKVIEYLKRKAQEVQSSTYGTTTLKIPKITPIIIDGQPKYVCVISRLMAKALRADANWLEGQQYANIRGNKNPLFSGALGEWDGVVIKVSERLPQRVGAGGVTTTEYFNDFGGATADAAANGITVDRGVFCGKDAVNIAWGLMPQKTSAKIDIGRLDAVAVSMIYGTMATRFSYYAPNWSTGSGTNSATELYGAIVFDTVVDTDT